MKLDAVPRIDATSLVDFEHQVAKRRLPVVVTTTGDQASKVATWALAELVSRFGNVKVPVRESHDEFRMFFGAGGGMRARKMMSLAEYVALAEGAGHETKDLPYAGNISIRDPAVAATFAGLLEECRFPQWLPGTSEDEHRFWIGLVGQRSTIHNDPYHNFNAQIIGVKRFVLYAPEQHDHLYPEFHHAAMWASPVDPDAPDLTKYPKFAKARGYECELQPGEILYIPRFWWHAVQTRQLAVNVNRWVYSDEARWHQQPEARPFISYSKLRDLVVRQFDSLPQFLQEHQRPEFDRLRDELEALDARETEVA